MRLQTNPKQKTIKMVKKTKDKLKILLNLYHTKLKTLH